jgi:hypothetical protein
MQKVIKVRSSDIVAYDRQVVDTLILSYGEVGPGRTHEEDTVWFEVYPIVPLMANVYKYSEESIWIPHTRIRKHFSVRKANDFYKAWVSLEFNPIVDENEVFFEPLFEQQEQQEQQEQEGGCLFESVESLFEDDDDNQSLRSVDTFSSMDDTESADSFITDYGDEHESGCECDHCRSTRQAVTWFDREWKPTDETENKVKTFIEYLEHKYCCNKDV